MSVSLLQITSVGHLSESRLALALGAVGLVIIISALISGLVDRGPVSEVLIFIAIGVVVGPWGLDVIDFDIDAPAVVAAGTISLVLVFFIDAIKINVYELRKNWFLPALALGPGALLTILLTTVVAHWLFGLSWMLSLLIGAVLSSTDAVLLRDVLNDKRVPKSIRNTLSVEAGTNDVIILPLVLIATVLAMGEERSNREWVEFGLELYVIGPLLGVLVAAVAIKLLDVVRKRQLVRRDYESLYSIGVAFVAYAAAQSVGGSGFLAAFAAGLTISFMDTELCDCFIEYGETTAEMAMLLTFVFLGGALLFAAREAVDAKTLLFALFVIFIARPVAFFISLFRANISRDGKIALAWFGPRGLNSLLLVILAVVEGLPQPEVVFGIVSVVVLMSVVLHGSSATPLLNRYEKKQKQMALPEETAVSPSALLNAELKPVQLSEVPRITPEALYRLILSDEPHTVFDVRRRSAGDDSVTIPGAIRVTLDDLGDWTGTLPKGPRVVLYCSCPEDASAARGATILMDYGYPNVFALEGGWNAWQAAGYPVATRELVAA
jgi:NhaP-type Na+/H+ or K+/H+ antiporter/rhodanese-related sulfurtransferase